MIYESGRREGHGYKGCIPHTQVAEGSLGELVREVPSTPSLHRHHSQERLHCLDGISERLKMRVLSSPFFFSLLLRSSLYFEYRIPCGKCIRELLVGLLVDLLWFHVPAPHTKKKKKKKKINKQMQIIKIMFKRKEERNNE